MINIDRLELNCRLAIESWNKYLPATKIDTAIDMIELIALLRQAEKDAARYRWLRDTSSASDFDVMTVLESSEWDEAIDEAMQCK